MGLNGKKSIPAPLILNKKGKNGKIYRFLICLFFIAKKEKNV